jgi:glycosyltransferase involved in cell wall biosynthesis
MLLLSIITITRNNRDGLIRTLDSCQSLLQRDDVEVVIVDGASTDDTMNAVAAWRATAPEVRCVALSERDKGIYDAMNKGLRLASGRHVVFMNSGDLFSPDLQLDPTTLEADSVHYGDARFESPQGCYAKHYRIDSVGSFLDHNTFCHQALYYPRRLLLELGGYDLDYRVSADFDLTLRCFLRTLFRSLDCIGCVCELGGFSHVHGWRSYKERMRSLRAHAGLRWWWPLAAYAPVFYFKHRLVKALDGSRLLMWYRHARYG